MPLEAPANCTMQCTLQLHIAHTLHSLGRMQPNPRHEHLTCLSLWHAVWSSHATLPWVPFHTQNKCIPVGLDCRNVSAVSAAAGTMSSFICSPTELLKIRMQLQRPLPGTPGYLGPWGMLRHLVRNEGLSGESLSGSD
jgi:hypothetical protein